MEAEINTCIPPTSTKINSGDIRIASIGPCRTAVGFYFNDDISCPFEVVAHVIGVCTDQANLSLKGTVLGGYTIDNTLHSLGITWNRYSNVC